MINNDWLVIINPHAGSNKCEKDWPKVSRLLSAKAVTYNAIFTKKRGDAIKITKQQLKRGYRNFIIVGGDGTLNEVINGIFTQQDVEHSSCCVAAIPVGTGNDWRRTHNISNSYEEAIDVIVNNQRVLHDIGKVTYLDDQNRKRIRFFINASGLGFDAIVCHKVNILKEQNRGGRGSYMFSLLSGLFAFDHFKANIAIDDLHKKCNIFSFTVGICNYIGGGMKMVPHAHYDDGKLSTTVIRRVPKLKIIRNISRLKDGSFTKIRQVDTYTSSSVSIDSESEMILEADGESLGKAPCTFTVEAKAIQVITNPV